MSRPRWKQPREPRRTWPRPTNAEAPTPVRPAPGDHTTTARGCTDAEAPSAAGDAPQPDPDVRLRLDFGYDGTGFGGWAAQPGRRTVEGVLAPGLATVLRLTSHPRLTVAGRTDAGVHARGAVAHLDLPGALWRSVAERGRAAEQTALRRLRGVLPQDVGVHRIRPVPKDFDARFSALFRRYQYRICDRPAEADPLRRFETLCHPRPLDEEAMARASSRLLGLADFAAFCRRREGASTIRTLIAFDWGRAADDGVLVATVVADAFCHSMVRALVGAAVAVGEGRRDEAWPLAVRQGRRRDPAVTVMPALGLILEEVGYPPAELFAERARQSRARREPAPGGG